METGDFDLSIDSTIASLVNGLSDSDILDVDSTMSPLGVHKNHLAATASPSSISKSPSKTVHSSTSSNQRKDPATISAYQSNKNIYNNNHRFYEVSVELAAVTSQGEGMEINARLESQDHYASILSRSEDSREECEDLKERIMSKRDPPPGRIEDVDNLYELVDDEQDQEHPEDEDKQDTVSTLWNFVNEPQDLQGEPNVGILSHDSAVCGDDVFNDIEEGEGPGVEQKKEPEEVKGSNKTDNLKESNITDTDEMDNIEDFNTLEELQSESVEVADKETAERQHKEGCQSESSSVVIQDILPSITSKEKESQVFYSITVGSPNDEKDGIKESTTDDTAEMNTIEDSNTLEELRSKSVENDGMDDTDELEGEYNKDQQHKVDQQSDNTNTIIPYDLPNTTSNDSALAIQAALDEIEQDTISILQELKKKQSTEAGGTFSTSVSTSSIEVMQSSTASADKSTPVVYSEKQVGIHGLAAAAVTEKNPLDDDVLKEYTARREIATKVLGHKMLQGYRLKDCQCDQCGMPKMEFESIVLCVVCPVLARKAHKELKKRQKLKEQPSKNPTMTDSSSITCTIEEGEIEDVAKTETTSVDVEDSLVENVLHKMVKDNEEQLHGGEKQLPEKHAEEKMSPGECVKKDIFNNDGHLCLIVAPRAPRTAKEAEDRRVDLATLEKTVLAEARAAKEESMTYTKSETSMPSKQSREAVLKRKQDEKKAEALRSDFLQLIHETKRLETMERMRMAKEIEFKTAEEQSLAVLALQEERKRLHREAKRQKEKQSQAASLVEKSVDMKCADVAKSNVAKSNANEVEIMEAPETAKEKGKKETTSIFKVNASVKEENTEQNYILAEIIAKGEAKTIAEVESIVRSEAEDYHEREVCRSNSQLLRERWELLRVEGKSVMTRRLIAGWKMLPRTCSGKECQKSPLLKKGRIEECVVCGGSGNGVDGVYVETLSLSATSEDGDYDAPVVLSPNNDGREPKAETTSLAPKSVQQIHEDFEVKREKVSKEIGKRMLQGWTLLDMSCPKCVMPLLTDENGENEICVLCGVVGQLSPEDETLPEKASDKKQQKKYDDNSHRDDTSSTFDASKPPNTKEMKQDAFMFEQCKDLKTVWDHEGRQHLDDMQAACTQTKEQLIDFGEMTKEILSKHEDQSPLIQVVSMMSDIPCRPVDLGLGLHDAYDYAEEAINKKPYSRRGVSDPEIQDNSVQQSNDSQSAYGLARMRVSSNDNEVCMVHIKEANAALEESDENSFSQNEDKSVTSVAVLPVDRRGVSDPEIQDNSVQQSNDSQSAYGLTKMRVSSNDDEVCVVQTKEANAAFEESNENSSSQNEDKSVTSVAVLPADSMLPGTSPKEDTPSTKASVSAKAIAPAEFSHTPDKCKVFTRGATATALQMLKSKKADAGTTPKKRLSIDIDAANNRFSPESPRTPAASKTPVPSVSSVSPMPSPRNGRTSSPSPRAKGSPSNYQDLSSKLRTMLSDPVSPRHTPRRFPHSAPSSARIAARDVPDYLISSITGRPISFSGRRISTHDDPPAWSADAATNHRVPQDPETRMLAASSRVASPRTRMAISPVGRPPFVGRSPSPRSTRTPRSFKFPESPVASLSDEIELKSEKEENVMLVIPKNFDITNEAQLRDLIAAVTARQRQASPTTMIAPSPVNSQLAAEGRITNQGSTEIINVIDLELDENNSSYQPLQIDTCSSKLESSQKEAQEALKRAHIASPGEQEVKNTFIVASPQRNNSSLAFSHENTLQHTRRTQRCPPTPESFRKKNVTSSRSISLSRPTRTTDNIEARPNLRSRSIDASSPRIRENSHAATLTPAGSRDSRSYAGASEIRERLNWTFSSSTIHSHYNKTTRNTTGIEPSSSHESTGLPPISPCRGLRKWSDSGNIASSNSSVSSLDVSVHDHHHHHHQQQQQDDSAGQQQQDVSAGHAGAGSFAGSQNSSKSNAKKVSSAFSTSSDVDCIAETLSSAENPITVEDVSVGHTKNGSVAASHQSLVINDKKSPYSFQVSSDVDNMMEEPLSCADNLFTVESLPNIRLQSSGSSKAIEAVFSTPSLPVVRYFEGGSGTSTSYHKSLLENFASTANNPISVEDPKETILPPSSIHVVNSQSYHGVEATGGSTSYHGSTSRSVASTSNDSIRSKQSSNLEAPKDILKALSSSMQNPLSVDEGDSSLALKAVQSSVSSAENPISVEDPKESILPASSIHVVNSQSYGGIEATGGSTSYHGSTSRSVASSGTTSIRSKQSSYLEAPKDILKALSSSMQNPADSTPALNAVQSSASSAENPILVVDEYDIQASSSVAEVEVIHSDVLSVSTANTTTFDGLIRRMDEYKNKLSASSSSSSSAATGTDHKKNNTKMVNLIGKMAAAGVDIETVEEDSVADDEKSITNK